MGARLGIAYRGRLVPEARLAVIRLTNAGRRPAMIHGLRIEVEPPAILGSAIDHTEPANLIPDERLAALVRLREAPADGELKIGTGGALHGAVELRDLFLNGQESIWMTVLTATRTRVRTVRHANGSEVPQEIDVAMHTVVAMTVFAVVAGLMVGSVLWLVAAWVGSW